MKQWMTALSRRGLCAIAALLLATVCMHAKAQDAQNPDLQVLKDKLEHLEQEMQELKAEIKAAEKASQPSAAVAAAPVKAAPAPTAAPPAPPAASEKASAEKASSEGTIDLYGFAMLDAGYDFNTTDPDWYDVVRPTKLPAFEGEFAPNGKVYFSVRQSRFGVKSSTPTRLGDLNTKFEFELYGTGVDAGQTTFRLRHAYGELGPILAGQTWTPFMDTDMFPNELEYWGPNGMPNFRNVQLRWTPVRTNRTELVLALERPGASADQGVYSGRIELKGVVPRFNLPDLSWHARINRDWGHVQLAGIFRKIGWVDTNNDQYNLSGTAFGWGLNLSSNLKLSKQDVAKFEVTYGSAIENYMNDAPVDIGIKNNFGNPITPVKGVGLPVFGVVGALDHSWSERFTSSLGYSMENIENSNAESASAFHQGDYAIANLLYHPIPRVTMGNEFQFGRRVNDRDGFNVNDYRLQFSFKYEWNKTWAY